MNIDEQRQALREGLAQRHYRHEYDEWHGYAGYRWENVPDHYEGKQHSYIAADADLAYLHSQGRNVAAQRLVDVYGLDPFQAMEYAGVMCDAIFGTAPIIEETA